MSEPQQPQEIPATTQPRRRVCQTPRLSGCSHPHCVTANPVQSSGWMPAYEGLTRNRNEGQAAARRQSMSDQQAKMGIFGNFFHKYVLLLPLMRVLC